MLTSLLTLFLVSGWAMDVSDWRVVNDTVMGGVSQSAVMPHQEEGVVFQGQLSLENNGGFTSTRYRVPDGDWRRYRAVRLTVKGDGRAYIATIRTRGLQNRGLYYRQTFQTVAGKNQVFVLDLADFRPYSYGRLVSGAPALVSQVSQVETFGIMLADKNPGPFRLHIAGYELEPSGAYAVGEESVEVVSAASAIQAVFELAIAEGVPLFNGGEVQRCADIYRKSIESVLILSPGGLTASDASVLRSGLNRARRQDSATDQAWTLREAMDAYLSRQRY